MTPGYRALREGAGYLDLSARGKIAVRGPDRARLLHALTTSDIRSLVPGTGCYTFFLNAQGRVLADASVFCLPDEILLDTEPETRNIILNHIEEFTIADDATVADVTPSIGTISVEGPQAREVLKTILPALPPETYQIALSRYGWITHVSTTGQPGWMVFTPSAVERQFVLDVESAGARHANIADARVVRIENGKPRFGEEITTRFLGPETGQTSAIHPRKGCYLGQEIVERLRSRNAVSRVLTRIYFDSGTGAAPGTKLHDGNMRAGEIMSAVYSPQFGRWVGLAYVRSDLIRPGGTLSFDSGRVTIPGMPKDKECARGMFAPTAANVQPIGPLSSSGRELRTPQQKPGARAKCCQ